MGDLYFNANFAKIVGLEKAIIYEYVEDNLEGKPFKAAQLADVFPFWSKSKIGESHRGMKYKKRK